MDGMADFKTHQERIASSLVSVVRTATQISSQDLSFHRAANEQFSQLLDAQNSHLLKLTNKILRVAVKDTTKRAPILQDLDGVDENWTKVTEVVDDLLEKADTSLDEFTGVLKRTNPSDSDAIQPPAKKVRQGTGIDQWAHASMQKPQLLFNRKVDNYDTTAWKPLLKTKPHAIISLEESIGNGDGGYDHPYAHEIESLQYPQSLYNPAPPIKYTPPSQSEAIFVDTEEAVHEMLQELKQAKEIAIDLEHNDKNSYVGLVCLMQISTRNKDWIVDTLKPWRENLQVLNQVFADPSIVKIFHGSTSDIIWLQRDLGLYIVGLFDTFHASSALQFPGKSLKYLLQRFANFEAQKQFQLSDWRIRPLPKDLLDYARSDTHYLLYIFDCLKVMLKEASTPNENLMDRVLESSKRETLQVYERHTYDREDGLGPAGWLRLLMSRSTGWNNEQFGVFRALHEWRDRKGRELDEGEQYVMPNQYLFNYAENMPTRRPMFFQRGIPGRLPQAIVENIPEICEIVKKAREEGKNGPSIYEAIAKNGDKVGYMFGRNKYLKKKKSEDINRGLGATLQLLNGTGELSTPPSTVADDTLPDVPITTRSTASQLFGNIKFTPDLIPTNPAIIMQALQSVMPLNVQHNAGLETNGTTPPRPIAAEPAQPNPVTNGVSQVSSGVTSSTAHVFSISDRNKKRKAEEAMTSDSDFENNMIKANQQALPTTHEASDNINTVDEAAQEARQLKKAEKRAKKIAQAVELKAAQENVLPFDYANAESMLHAKPEKAGNGAQGQGKAKAKPLNPFLKALDTGTGARQSKMGKELGGKSHTFTS